MQIVVYFKCLNELNIEGLKKINRLQFMLFKGQLLNM